MPYMYTQQTTCLWSSRSSEVNHLCLRISRSPDLLMNLTTMGAEYLCHSHRNSYRNRHKAAKRRSNQHNFLMLQALVFGFLALACWRLLRRFFSRTVLDNVPGPSPSSFWAGKELNSPFPYLQHMTYHEPKDLYLTCTIPEHGIFIRKW